MLSLLARAQARIEYKYEQSRGTARHTWYSVAKGVSEDRHVEGQCGNVKAACCKEHLSLHGIGGIYFKQKKKERHMFLECTIMSICCELVNTSKDEWRILNGYEPCFYVQVLPRQVYLRVSQTLIHYSVIVWETSSTHLA